MLAAGVILILLGLFVPAVHVLLWVGVIVAVIGAVLLLASASGRGPRLY